jgi:hypothetical protein
VYIRGELLRIRAAFAKTFRSPNSVLEYLQLVQVKS